MGRNHRQPQPVTVRRLPKDYRQHRFQIFEMTTKGPLSTTGINAGLGNNGDLEASSHAGNDSSGMGFDWKSFLHCLAVHRAQVLDFLRRALSVEIPVPAYICR